MVFWDVEPAVFMLQICFCVAPPALAAHLGELALQLVMSATDHKSCGYLLGKVHILDVVIEIVSFPTLEGSLSPTVGSALVWVLAGVEVCVRDRILDPGFHLRSTTYAQNFKQSVRCTDASSSCTYFCYHRS